jgi:hypothetical protein
MVMQQFGPGIVIFHGWEITSKYIIPEENCVILYVLQIVNAPISHIIVALVS